MTDSLAPLQAGEGRWIRGAPGSGKTHLLHQLASQWPGPVVWLRSHELASDLAVLEPVPSSVLVCIDDCPEYLDRGALDAPNVLVTGSHPGEDWDIRDVPGMSTDAATALFLRHAPGASPEPTVRALVQQLAGHPMAIIAAARQWPLRKLDHLLLEPNASWPGLRAAYDALSPVDRQSLALLSHLRGPAWLEGLEWCGRDGGVRNLVSAGWLRVNQPGILTLSPAIADVIRPWEAATPAPYFSWLLQRFKTQAEYWDDQGGQRDWFRCQLWPELWAWSEGQSPGPWFFEAWSLSGEAPEVLLNALGQVQLDPVVAARCRARVMDTLGDRVQAEVILEGVAKHVHAFATLEHGVALHRLRQLPEAAARYGIAMGLFDASDHPRGRLLCIQNQAAIAHDLAELDAAHAGYVDALQLAKHLQERRLHGIISSNLGALQLEIGRLNQARAHCQQAIRDLTGQTDTRFLGITWVNLAAVELLEGHLDAADSAYAQAQLHFGETNPSSTALVLARRGAVAALRGELESARSYHLLAEQQVSALEDPLTGQLVQLWRLFLDWQSGDRQSALGRRRDALAGPQPLVGLSDEARLVLRLLEQVAGQPTSMLIVGPAGTWFKLPEGERVSVARYGNVARMLAKLAETAEQEPGKTCDAAALVNAGWPGESIVPEAAKNRLSVGLARLRKLGLRDVLQRTKAGWRLDPDWPVLLLRLDDSSR